MVIGLVGELDRVARECDRHIGHQVQPADSRRKRQWGEHIVRALEGEHPRCAGFTQGTGPLDGIGGPEQGGKDFHGTNPRLRRDNRR